MMNNVSYITNEQGIRTSVVLSIDEYNRLSALDDEQFTPIDYEADSDDDVQIPHEVMCVKVKNQVSLMAAWRIYRGLSQAEVAEKLGTSQAAVSQLEKAKKPQEQTRKTLAGIYGCKPEQLI